MTTPMIVLTVVTAGGANALLLVALKSEWHVQVNCTFWRKGGRHRAVTVRRVGHKPEEVPRGSSETLRAVLRPATGPDSRETRH